ncbi:diacylglycerol/polyprenol kinase family protein [Palaeococcus ferrophilus]|uniref:diacylglycerol/polyprenol kinase family protein n=1 Tax=Palaeococcus ferrophilus TaxID=83868 RepID=UPI00064FEB5C|nr:phosphatidate cytidylyltransferase [Palaeococcus ferrophilus]
MEGTWDLLIVVLLYVAAVMGIAHAMRGRFSPEFTRRVVHILAGDIIVVLPLFKSLPWVIAIPALLALFVLLGIALGLPIRDSLVPEGDDPLHAYGPVYYIVSIGVLVAAFGTKSVIPVVATFVMAWGDGFAAMVGMKFGRRRLWGGKTLEGSIAFFVFSFLGALVAISLWSRFSGVYVEVLKISLLTSITGTLVELGSVGKLEPFDNFTVPLCVALILALLP